MAPTSKPAELLMPVSDERALQQFQIEALQRINDNLRLLNNGQTETVKALSEMREGLHAIDVRLVRIESASVNVQVAELKEEVAELKTERDKRSGAIGALEWIGRFGPWLLAFVLGLAAIAGWGGRIK